jgi:Tol biopolymer transport system component
VSLRAGKRGKIAAVAVAAFSLLALVPHTAHATFPGRPGLLVFNLTLRSKDHSVFSGGLYSIRPGQQEPVQLTTNAQDYEPSFDPSGERLAFRRIAPPPSAESASGLFVRNMRSGAVRKLTSMPSDIDPSFGPHGTLVFSRYVSETNSYDLFFRGRAGRLRRLTSDTLADEAAVFTPNGKRIIFSRHGRLDLFGRKRVPTEREGLYSIRLDGSGLQPIGPILQASNLDISPNGDQLAYNVFLGAPGSYPESEAWTQRLADGRPKLFSREASFPSYAPDGDKIVYSNYSGLWTRRVKGRSNPMLILEAKFLPADDEGELLLQPAWQPLP